MQCVKLSNRNGNQLKDEDANLERRGKSSSGNVNVEQRQVKATGCARLDRMQDYVLGWTLFVFSSSKGIRTEANIAVNQKVLKARSAAFGLIALAFCNRADRLKG